MDPETSAPSEARDLDPGQTARDAVTVVYGHIDHLARVGPEDTRALIAWRAEIAAELLALAESYLRAHLNGPDDMGGADYDRHEQAQRQVGSVRRRAQSTSWASVLVWHRWRHAAPPAARPAAHARPHRRAPRRVRRVASRSPGGGEDGREPPDLTPLLIEVRA
jgi:hypothetical protein